MKVSGQKDLEHSSYDLSKFFFEELKKLSPPKLNHIWGQWRHQKLRIALIFNMTIQLFVVFKNRGARAKLKIWLLIWNQIKVKLSGQNFKVLSFALFFKSTENWMVILKLMASLNFCCLRCPHIWFSLGGDSFLSSSKKTQKF